MLRARFADGDERRRFGQPVELYQLPAEVSFHPLNGRGRGRRPGGDDADVARCANPDLLGRVGQHDQHLGAAQRIEMRSRATSSNTSAASSFGRQTCTAADRGDRPRERPAVGVEHRQRPEIPISGCHRQVDECADDVHVGVAVRDHHALRPRRRSARVVDRQEVAFADRPAGSKSSEPSASNFSYAEPIHRGQPRRRRPVR